MSSGFNGGREPIKVLRDIIKSELALDDDRIMLQNQKIDIRPIKGLYVVLSYLNGKPIGSNNFTTPTNYGLSETQEVLMRHQIQIDIMSADDSARLQKEQVMQALNSIFSQQQQTLNGMQISKVTGEFINASSLEETKILSRYTIAVYMTSLYSLTKPLTSGIFEKFPVTIIDDNDLQTVAFEAESTPNF